MILGEAALYLDPQPLGGEGALVVHQVQAVGVDLQHTVPAEDPEVGFGKVPVKDGLGGPVLKDPVGAVLQAHQPLGEHGDAVVLPGDHIVRAGGRCGIHTVD